LITRTGVTCIFFTFVVGVTFGRWFREFYFGSITIFGYNWNFWKQSIFLNVVLVAVVGVVVVVVLVAIVAFVVLVAVVAFVVLVAIVVLVVLVAVVAVAVAVVLLGDVNIFDCRIS